MRIAFRSELEDEIPANGPEQGSLADLGSSSVGVLVIVIAMFASYPLLSYFESPVWLAALVGAVLTTAVGLREHTITVGHALRGVAWDIIAFLFFIFVTALGLENIGATRVMARLYGASGARSEDGLAVIGACSAIGSAVLNNHPMAALNALAIASLGGDNRWRTLAALVGGDLGPRFLPIGSLAGLLWLEMTRRLGVEIRATRFIRTGVIVTLPTLAISLFVLWLEARFL
jgi:arsenical pump membrane protein